MRSMFLIAALALAAGPTLAQGTTPAKPMAMPMPATTTASPPPPADQSMMTAMDRMSKAMAAAPMSGNPDQDFVAMMIPHHQGAVDMARFELAHGKDPAMRRLAQAIVAAQEKELGTMHAWQARHTAKP